ncbi:MAG TPA: hypothetical protein VHG52_11395 [Thermomicrobiales bacterium]|nr:hypothetical protein [Thermomicrobiales bacterium]
MSDNEPTGEPQPEGASPDPARIGEPRTGGIREITYKMPATRESAPATEATKADVGNIEAQTVMMKQSGAEQITADRVVMEQSGAKSIEAKSAQLDQSGVVALGSDHTVLMQSSAIQVVAEEARLSKSSAFIVSAKQARLEESKVVLFAGTADGEVKTLFTPVTAAALGAGFGLIFALASLVIRALSDRE